MSDLTAIEKRKLERALGMGSGYVLDFSNRTFAEFFLDNFGIDIYDDKSIEQAPWYVSHGDCLMGASGQNPSTGSHSLSKGNSTSLCSSKFETETLSISS